MRPRGTTSRLTILELKSQRVGVTVQDWTKKMENIFGRIKYGKEGDEELLYYIPYFEWGRICSSNLPRDFLSYDI
jgi:hypothetical protein